MPKSHVESHKQARDYLRILPVYEKLMEELFPFIWVDT